MFAKKPTLRYLMMALVLAFLPVHAAESMNYWNIEKLLSLRAEEIELSNETGKSFGIVRYERLLLLNEVRARIEKSSGIKADLYIVTGDNPNCFATNVITGRNLFAINLPMIDEIGTDSDALASLMGHEIAHIERKHIRHKTEAAKDIQTGSQVAGIILALAGVHGAGTLSNAGANLISSGYSRDQEREADTYGLEFARKAGFNPHGGVRLFSRINEKHGDKWVTFLSKHPSHAERIQTMKERIATASYGISLSETQVTAVDMRMPQLLEPRAIAQGEYRPTVFDTEERAPTLYQKIRCRRPDGSEVNTTRVDCIQQDGSILK